MTAKRQFRRALQSRIAPHTDDLLLVEKEIRELKAILASSGQLDFDVTIELELQSTTLDIQGIQRLAKLLELDDDEPSLWTDEHLTASFEHQLATPLREPLAQISPRLNARLALMVSEDAIPIVTFGDLFGHPNPPIEILRAVKDWSTRCMQEKSCDAPPQIAPVIYLASVAAALLRCRERITHSDNTDLQVTFRQALGAKWVGPQIRGLFVETLDRIS